VDAGVDELIAEIVEDPGFSGRVVLTTIFGDALLPRRQKISVKALASLVEPLHVNERSVRTSLLRLTREDLVTSEREGRHSHYSVHADAEQVFQKANRRIYRPQESLSEWDGAWTIAVIDADSADRGERTQVARELGWLGMTTPRLGVHVSPTLMPAEIEAVGDRLGVAFSAVLRGALSAGTIDGEDQLAALVDPTGRLGELHLRHQNRFARFADNAGELGPADAFAVRTLLIDSWRRIALRTPLLPRALMPSAWPGAASHALTERVHRACFDASNLHLDAVVGPGAVRPSPFD
jgi:phenylacetic acid degradation operon negative regulatory protein